VLKRSPDESEKRRYRSRIFEDHWGERDIEDDLRERRDYRARADYYRDSDSYYYKNTDRNRDRDSSSPRMSDRDIDRMIRHAYEDVLGREPDSDGLRTYRNNVIDRGWTERQVREALRDSSEHKQNTHAATDRIVKHAYNTVLGRDPDPSGLYQYRNQIEQHGWDEHDVERSLRDSPEYRQKNSMSQGDARAIVRRAYQSVLGRDPDPASSVYVDRVLRDHWTERDVARELRNSDEFRNKQR
jgi:hypothetical protein